MSERVEVPVAHCKSCDAEIIWAATIKKDGTPGKMPFDRVPDASGNYYLTRRANGDIFATYVGKGTEFPPGGQPRVSHFKTCPNADQHRKGK